MAVTTQQGVAPIYYDVEVDSSADYAAVPNNKIIWDRGIGQVVKKDTDGTIVSLFTKPGTGEAGGGNFAGYTVENINSLPYTTQQQAALNKITYLNWEGVLQYDGVDYSTTLNANGTVTIEGTAPLIPGSGQVKYVATGTVENPATQLNAPGSFTATASGETIINLSWTDTNA